MAVNNIEIRDENGNIYNPKTTAENVTTVDGKTVDAKFAETKTALESGNILKKDANGNVILSGNLTLKGSGNFGNKINFGDGDYVHIWEPTDDTLEIKATRIKMYSGSTEVMKIEGSRAYINGVEINSGSLVLDFDVLCSSKGSSCVTVESSDSYTETITKIATAKKAAMRTTTKISNGYSETITFYGGDGVTVVETRTKAITKTSNGWSEVTT